MTLKDYVTTVTNQDMCNLIALYQEPSNLNNATIVAKQVTLKQNVLFNVVITVIKLAISPENVQNQKNLDFPALLLQLPRLDLRFLVTDVVVQTIWLRTAYKVVLNAIHVVNLVTYLRIVQVVLEKRFVTIVMNLAISPKIVQLIELSHF